MKKKNFLLSLLVMLMFGLMSIGFASCSDDDDDVLPKVTIANNSTYSLYRFRVVFVNSRFEEIDDKDFGTLDPGKTVTCDIPTGATEFYMATYQSGVWFFSPNYEVAYKNINLSTSMINNWTTNSSANRYPKASSAK